MVADTATLHLNGRNPGHNIALPHEQHASATMCSAWACQEVELATSVTCMYLI